MISILPIIIICIVVILIVVSVLVSSGSSTSDVPLETTDADILREAQAGRKIQAIKWYRSLYGVGLKEAKEAVEKMLKDA